MASLVQCPPGTQLENRHVQQILAALLGLGDGVTQDQGVQFNLIGYADASNYQTVIRNRGAGGKALKIRNSADTVTLLQVDDSGVLLSPDGVIAATNPWIYKNMVVAWNAASGTIPTNWAVCDGTGGTPDLRDKFIVGAGSTYALGASGGATTHSHSHAHTSAAHAHSHLHTGPSHVHALGNHSHTGSTNNQSITTGLPSATKTINTGSVGTSVVPDDLHTHANTHNHVIQGENADSNTGGTGNTSTDATSTTPGNTGTDATTGSSLPPYWSLYWILRTV